MTTDRQKRDDAANLLVVADVGYTDNGRFFLNMNDVWFWASAWGEEVDSEEILEVAALFKRWGWAGLLYWVSEQNEQMTSEFHDNNRAIEFVRFEEELIKSLPNSDDRAFLDIRNPALPTKTMWQRLKAITIGIKKW